MATMQRLDQIDGYDQALRVIAANRDPRFNALDELERWVSTTQYDGRQDWWAAGKDAKPLWERRPCIAYPIVDTAISSNADLLLGEGRFPAITTIPEQVDEGDETDLQTARKRDKTIQRLAERARLRKVSYEVFSAAQGCGTAVTICGVRGKRPFIDTTRAKWCTAEFDLEGNVTRLEIKYPYLDRYKVQGHWKVRVLIFRRVIDDQTDTTYLPAEGREDGSEPKTWTPDPKQTYQHGFGFCPIVWYAHMREAAIVNRIDGHAIHEHCLDEIQAHDFALSQRHRAALYCGDPQWVETGVDDGPEATGQTAQPPILSTPLGGIPGSDNPINGSWVVPGRQKARRKGPGEVWTYPNENAKVALITLPGDALKAIDDHARDLRIKISESLAVVFLDPEGIKFAASLSGKALATLKARQLDRCDQYRDDFGFGWLIPQVKMLLRVAAAKGLDKTGTLPDPEDEDTELHLRWGDYFKRAPDEEQQLVALVATANKDNLVTRRRLLQKLAQVFDIDNVDDELAKLEEESKKRAEEQREQFEAQAAATQKLITGGNPIAGGPGARGNPPQPTAGNGGSIPAATPQGSQRPIGKPGRRR